MKLLSFFFLFCIVASVSSTVSAQHKVAAEQDFGIDTAVVIAIRANLREHPNARSAIVKEVSEGDLLGLLDRQPVGPWYRVLHIQSSTEGWINGNTIRLRYTEKPSGGPVFEERATGTNEDPSIQIKNDTDGVLYLKIGDDDRIVISPRRTTNITKAPGQYSFYASSPGILPRIGQHEFRTGVIYEWTFYIVTTFK